MHLKLIEFLTTHVWRLIYIKVTVSSGTILSDIVQHIRLIPSLTDFYVSNCRPSLNGINYNIDIGSVYRQSRVSKAYIKSD